MGRSLVRHGDDECSTIDVVCFPAAGEPAARFAGWSDHLPSGAGLIAVERPGRGRRMGEPLVESLDAIATETVNDLVDHLTRPLVLVGHSAGSLVAHATATRLAGRADAPEVLAVVASHGRSPVISRPIRWADAAHGAIAAELLELRPEIEPFLRRADFAAFFLDALRADLRLYPDEGAEIVERLTCPIIAIGGAHDDLVSATDLWRWSEATRGAFVAQLVGGSHFVCVEDPATFVPILLRLLGAHVPGWSP